ncbi:MAG: hypothetical protein WAO35_15115 [Terriglobia bacterium]
MAVTNMTRWNPIFSGMLPMNIHPFVPVKGLSRARQVHFEAPCLIFFITIGFHDMLGKPYNDIRVPNYVCL